MNGRDITDQPAHERNFAMVFQALALFPFLTVEQNIAYSLRSAPRTGGSVMRSCRSCCS
jgi:ABC-type Fe3+/spermidine/putrescine transport system ATPase subunit